MYIDKINSNKAVIIPEGKIDITNSNQLKQQLLALYDEGLTEIIIDFTNVTSIDSSGLGKLLLFQKKLRERQGELIIINITSEYVSKMFKMIHLHKVINIKE